VRRSTGREFAVEEHTIAFIGVPVGWTIVTMPPACVSPPAADPLRRFVLRQFLQTSPDRARCHAGCHRHRGNATIPGGKSFGRRDQTTAPFVEKRRYRGKPLPDGFNIDHDHNIRYDKATPESGFRCERLPANSISIAGTTTLPPPGAHHHLLRPL
jgi:hypothetical protein